MLKKLFRAYSNKRARALQPRHGLHGRGRRRMRGTLVQGSSSLEARLPFRAVQPGAAARRPPPAAGGRALPEAAGQAPPGPREGAGAVRRHLHQLGEGFGCG